MLNIYKDAVDYSLELEDYLDKTVTETITTSDKLLIGYYKPINSVYIEMSTANVNPTNLSIKYYNGTSFVDISSAVDRTFDLTESGFISWDRNLEDEAETEINSITQYWYEITIDADTSAITFDGINLVLSDDKDMQNYESQIRSTKWYPTGKDSFIGFHQGARNEIIQHLRNQGKGKYNGTEFKDLNVFDLIDSTQLKVASTYLVLSNVFFNYSDRPDDKYAQKYSLYKGKYEEALNVFYLSIDSDDDGIEDTTETPGIQYKTITRI